MRLGVWKKFVTGSGASAKTKFLNPIFDGMNIQARPGLPGSKRGHSGLSAYSHPASDPRRDPTTGGSARSCRRSPLFRYLTRDRSMGNMPRAKLPPCSPRPIASSGRTCRKSPTGNGRSEYVHAPDGWRWKAGTFLGLGGHPREGFLQPLGFFEDHPGVLAGLRPGVEGGGQSSCKTADRR